MSQQLLDQVNTLSVAEIDALIKSANKIKDEKLRPKVVPPTHEKIVALAEQVKVVAGDNETNNEHVVKSLIKALKLGSVFSAKSSSKTRKKATSKAKAKLDENVHEVPSSEVAADEPSSSVQSFPAYG